MMGAEHPSLRSDATARTGLRRSNLLTGSEPLASALRAAGENESGRNRSSVLVLTAQWSAVPINFIVAVRQLQVRAVVR